MRLQGWEERTLIVETEVSGLVFRLGAVPKFTISCFSRISIMDRKLDGVQLRTDRILLVSPTMQELLQLLYGLVTDFAMEVFKAVDQS